jgi:hypothetical protein
MDFYKFAGKSRVRHTSLTSSQINVSNFTSSSSTSLLGSLMSSMPVARQKHSHTLTSEQSRASWVMSKNSSVILVKETMVNVSHLFHRHCSAGQPNVFIGDYFPASKEGYNISSVNMKKKLTRARSEDSINSACHDRMSSYQGRSKRTRIHDIKVSDKNYSSDGMTILFPISCQPSSSSFEVVRSSMSSAGTIMVMEYRSHRHYIEQDLEEGRDSPDERE